VANTWFQQKEKARHTWTSPDGQTKNQIDYILASARFRNSIRNCKSRPGAYCGSDHNPVIVNLNIRLKNIKKKKSDVKRWNVDALKQESVRMEYAEKMEDKAKNILEENCLNVNQTWKRMKECITEVAENIIGTKVVDRKQQGMTCEILNMMSKRKELRNQGKKDELTVMNREIKKECRKAKEEYYKKKCKELEDRCNS